MKKRLPPDRLTCFILSAPGFLNSSKSFSQSIIFGTEKTQVKVGLNIGPSFFLGDLGGNRGKGTTFIKDVNLSLNKVMEGVFVAVYPNEWLGLRAAAEIDKMEGQDKIITTRGVDELCRKQRILDFRSNIAESYVAGEVFPLMY